MILIRLSASGLFGFAMRKDKDEIFTARASRAQVQAVTDFMVGRTSPTFADRLQPSAFGIYGFQRRDEAYQALQRRRLGGVFPYYGPWKRNFTRLAVALLRGKAKATVTALRDLIIRQVHMRDIITKPGIGFTVSQTVGARQIVTQLRLPGARVLNAGGAKNAIYRSQLGNFTLGGNRDSIAIYRRMGVLLNGALWRPIAAEPAQPLIA